MEPTNRRRNCFFRQMKYVDWRRRSTRSSKSRVEKIIQLQLLKSIVWNTWWTLIGDHRIDRLMNEDLNLAEENRFSRSSILELNVITLVRTKTIKAASSNGFSSRISGETTQTSKENSIRFSSRIVLGWRWDALLVDHCRQVGIDVSGSWMWHSTIGMEVRRFRKLLIGENGAPIDWFCRCREHWLHTFLSPWVHLDRWPIGLGSLRNPFVEKRVSLKTEQWWRTDFYDGKVPIFSRIFGSQQKKSNARCGFTKRIRTGGCMIEMDAKKILFTQSSAQLGHSTSDVSRSHSSRQVARATPIDQNRRRKARDTIIGYWCSSDISNH